VVLAVGAATLLRLVLRQPLGETVAFITFYPAMVVVAMFLGARAGVVATVLSALAADYFVMPPLYSLGPANSGHTVALALFMASGLLISLMARQLDLARRRFKDALDHMPVYLVLLTPDHRVPFANRFFEERFGPSDGRRCYEYLFQRTEPCENCETFKVLKTGMPHRWEWTGPDGRNYDVYDFPFTDSDGSPLVMEVGLDITERKRAEATVRRRAEQLQALAARLTQAEQNERQRLATILHDHLQQLLVGAKFHLGLLRGRRQDPDLREPLEQIDGLLDQSLETSRNLTVDLSPPILTHGNMAQVLGWLADWMRRKHGLAVELHADDEANPQAREARVLLFEATRELLFNVVKHARVAQAAVELSRPDDQHIQVQVRDQGVGFASSEIPGGHNGSGFGLLAIRERLDWLNGSFEVNSAPGRGTCATLTIPIVLPGVVGKAPLDASHASPK